MHAYMCALRDMDGGIHFICMHQCVCACVCVCVCVRACMYAYILACMYASMGARIYFGKDVAA